MDKGIEAKGKGYGHKVMYETLEYDRAVTLMRRFFQDKKGFIEVPTQSRLSILAACEDPATISQFVFDGINYPLPQTGQMWLEYELLKNPEFKGVYCISTSYRNEPNPIKGRHQKIFPMFEFESHGIIDDMIILEAELLEHLGFKKPRNLSYEDACQWYNTETIESKQEEEMSIDYGEIVSLQYFPQRTHPFWNMKHSGDGIYNKVDVIMYGQETIGSAERSCDADEMAERFLSISDGNYAKLLYNHFGKSRVEKELNDYLNLDMFPRFGGGIGMTRMARALKKAEKAV